MAKQNRKVVRGAREKIAMADLHADIANLLKDGLIKIVGHDEVSGEAIYAINEDWRPPRPH